MLHFTESIPRDRDRVLIVRLCLPIYEPLKYFRRKKKDYFLSFLTVLPHCLCIRNASSHDVELLQKFRLHSSSLQQVQWIRWNKAEISTPLETDLRALHHRLLNLRTCQPAFDNMLNSRQLTIYLFQIQSISMFGSTRHTKKERLEINTWRNSQFVRQTSTHRHTNAL